ncbi:MAG: outer membrane protein assembly factor BamD [Flavobacteriales bacterium]
MRVLSILILMIGFSSCISPADKALEQLKSEERAFYAIARDTVTTKESAKAILASYENYLNAFPNAPESEEIMLRYANVYEGTGQYFMALGVYDRFEKIYPKSTKRAFVLFKKGFVCEQAFNKSGFDKHKLFALDFYNQFVKAYPNSKQLTAVKYSIKELNDTESKIKKHELH